MKNRVSLMASHAHTLRVSLLFSLGLSPLAACGRTTNPAEGGDAGSSEAGAPASSGAGAATIAGATNHEAGSSSGGALGDAGAPSSGGLSSDAGARSDEGGSAGEPTQPQCDHPSLDPATGLVYCDRGFAHRARASVCSLPAAGAAGTSGEAGQAGSAQQEPCVSDADCGRLRQGYCKHSDIWSEPGDLPQPPMAGHCASGCLQDSDCATGSICMCDGSSTGGKCFTASCALDADCGANALCATVSPACGGTTFICTSAQDECLGDQDCPNHVCYTTFGGPRSCQPKIACGRPFLVENAPRFAEVTHRADWLVAEPSPSLTGLSALERAELAAHWARLGQLEHASIAAFARFNLQLLALGAPAELVEGCNRALVDETAHTKLCFAFASAYAGTNLGPTRLDLSACFADEDLVSIAKLVINEGCIGETVAALEAFEGAERASDPAVKNALGRIAHDEQNHAELAFRFLRWALEQCTAEQRRRLFAEAELRITELEAGAQEEKRAATRWVVRPLLVALGAQLGAA